MLTKIIRLITLGLLIVPLALALNRQSRQAAPPAPPNLLFLISDDHSASDLGCYGNRVVQTPNLDRMAREGMRFENAFVASPQCSPSRSAVLTGRSPHATGTSRLHGPLRAEYPTILESLKGQGYYTGAYRKVHLGDEFQKRWDFTATAKESFATFFTQRPKDRPFYLHIGFTDPHRPYQPGAFTPPHDPAKVAVPAYLPDTPEVRRDLALYHDAIARMDGEVGQILSLLDEQGLPDNTLIIFTGDNGMAFPGSKATLYEPGVRVPLLARWPGKIRSGEVSDDLISLIDLRPTWLEAAGLKSLDAMEGRSFLARLLGLAYSPREAVFFERNWHDNVDLIRGVRTRQFKLIQNYRPELPYRPTLDHAEPSLSWAAILALKQAGKLSPQFDRRFFQAPRPQVELYDLERDAWETNNLASDPAHADTVKRLQQMLSEWMLRTNDFLPPPVGAFPGAMYKNVNPL